MKDWEKWYRYTDNTRAHYLDPEGKRVEMICTRCGVTMTTKGDESLERMMFGQRHDEDLHTDLSGQLYMVMVPWR